MSDQAKFFKRILQEAHKELFIDVIQYVLRNASIPKDEQKILLKYLREFEKMDWYQVRLLTSKVQDMIREKESENA